MPSTFRPVLSALVAALVLVACGTPHQAVKPPPPVGSAARPVSDPPPSRVVIHATIFRDAMVKKLASSLPRQGEGDAELVAGRMLHYTWQREPVALKFDRGRIAVTVPVTARFNFLGEQQIPITVAIAGEPVVTADFKALLQSSDVQVHVSGPVDAVNRAIEGKLHDVITRTLEDFRFDLRPLLANAFARISRPIEFTVGDQKACAELRIAAIEAAPTLLADGVEKDLGVVVLPSVTLPCAPVTGGQSATASAAPGSAGSASPAPAGAVATTAAASGTAPATGTTASTTAPAVASAGTTAPAVASAGTTTSAQNATAPAVASGGTTTATVTASGTTAPAVVTAGGTTSAAGKSATPVVAAAGSPTPAAANAGGTPAPATPGSTPATATPPVAAPTEPPLPLLANVASLPTGPFKVVIPVAARYEELSKALESSMHGRLFFSTSYPELFLEKPEVYPSDDTIVIRMQLGGKAAVAGVPTTLSGEIFFAGHPHVIDNQITVPDLDITPGTADELVKLKFALDYASIREQARQALRVDVSERLAAVKNKLSTELSFDDGGACVRAQVLRSEVTGIYPHPSFLRIYTQVDAQTALYMPCKR